MPFTGLRLRESAHGVRSEDMERAERAGLFIFLCGCGMNMIAVAGPLAFPDAPIIVWRVVLGLGTLVTILSAAFLIYEYRHLSRSPRVIPLVGMIVFGLGFCVCAIWYFWPSEGPSVADAQHKQSSEPNKPGPLAGLTNTQLRERTLAFVVTLRDFENKHESEETTFR
jgi:hypothetical protein